MLREMKTRSILFFCAGALSVVFFLIILGFEENGRVKSTAAKFDSSYFKWTVPPVPTQMTFAGEKVPLEKWEIKEQLDRQFTLIYYQTGSMLTILKYANRWLPVIGERLKQNGIPEDFKYLCVAESNLQNLISSASAVGFWQFMSYTAPGFGLEVNSNVDERYHVLKSTDAASQYLKQAYNKFGSWTAAAASYNCGQGKYNEQSVFQRTKNYYDLQLPEETNHYMYRILSFKYLIGNQQKLGFVTDTLDLYAPYQTREIIISSTIPNLADFAINNGTTYRVLRILNPWLKGRSLPVRDGKRYTILLPL
ncbi:MAG TPA: lytic transglycosylase domain-containing protein [Chitinophagaceae bacterium]|nr:lytic transglycosylase domain-containing protein [Chitinophagaceae bacterium]